MKLIFVLQRVTVRHTYSRHRVIINLAVNLFLFLIKEHGSLEAHCKGQLNTCIRVPTMFGVSDLKR